MKKVTLGILLLTSCVFHPVFGQQLFSTNQQQDSILTFSSPGPGSVFVPNVNSGTQLNDPTGITFGPDGNVYVVSTGNGVVLRYDGTTGAALPGQSYLPLPPMSPPQASFTTGYGLSGAQGIAFGADGNLYVTNANNVSQFNGTTGAWIQNFTLTAPGGSQPFFTGIAADPVGNLYVSDANGFMSEIYGDSVLKLNLSSGMFTTFVASNTDGMQFPTGVTFGPDGDLYVASPAAAAAIGGEVRRFSGSGAFLGVFVSPVPALNGNLFQPQGLVFGPDGNLYVSSFFNSPPTFMDPGVNSFVARYQGPSGGMPGAFIDNYGQGTTSDHFFGVAFPTLAAIPEVSTIAIGALITFLLIFHSTRRTRLSLARIRSPNEA